MTFAGFLLLNLIAVVVILDLVECVSAILLQLILLPFSPLVIFVSTYVCLSKVPPLTLSIPSPVFVYLH